MKLIQLPSGSWVNPQLVKFIRPLKAESSALGTFPARVIVAYGDTVTTHEIIDVDNFDTASNMANEIAYAVKHSTTN